MTALKTKKYSGTSKNGFGLVEIIVAAAIVGVVLAGFGGLANFALKAQSHLKQNLISINLAAEAMDATKAFKEENWTNFAALSLNSPYHPAKTGSPLKWSLSLGTETLAIFTRQVVIAAVSRDTNDDIVQSGGTNDPGTRKVTVTISWTENSKNYQTQLTSYLTNWR